jgi:hypothetical protein
MDVSSARTVDERPLPPVSSCRTRVVGWFLVGLLATVVLGGIVVGLLREPVVVDLSTAHGTVQAYTQAVLDGRWADASDLLSEELSSRCTIADLRNAWVEEPAVVYLEDVQVADGRAEVRVVLRPLAPPDPFGADRGSTEVFDLVRESGAWRITAEPWPIYGCRG